MVILWRSEGSSIRRRVEWPSDQASPDCRGRRRGARVRGAGRRVRDARSAATEGSAEGAGEHDRLAEARNRFAQAIQAPGRDRPGAAGAHRARGVRDGARQQGAALSVRRAAVRGDSARPSRCSLASRSIGCGDASAARRRQSLLARPASTASVVRGALARSTPRRSGARSRKRHERSTIRPSASTRSATSAWAPTGAGSRRRAWPRAISRPARAAAWARAASCSSCRPRTGRSSRRCRNSAIDNPEWNIAAGHPARSRSVDAVGARRARGEPVGVHVRQLQRGRGDDHARAEDGGGGAARSLAVAGDRAHRAQGRAVALHRDARLRAHDHGEQGALPRWP